MEETVTLKEHQEAVAYLERQLDYLTRELAKAREELVRRGGLEKALQDYVR